MTGGSAIRGSFGYRDGRPGADRKRLVSPAIGRGGKMARMGRWVGDKVWLAAAVACVIGPSWSCSAPRARPSLTSDDVDLKIVAIKQAGERRDAAALPQLVADLDDDDAAVRLAAIEALGRFSSDRFGYAYYLETDDRRAAVERWRAWLKGRQDPSPATPAAP